MQPEVSIICITYNHAQFIAKALDSFVGQKTDFPFEVIVHDDCSTDGTTEIIREYARKYPDLIVPVYEEENCYSRGVRIVQPLLTEKARGKYIAFCEGDDSWCDTNKLQRQYQYMEGNPECSLLMHNGFFYDLATGKKGKINPYPADGILTSREVIVEGRKMPPTASMFFKRNDIIEMPELFLNASVGDRTRRLFLITRGYVYYMDTPMCVYNINTPGSFGQRVVKDSIQRKKVLDKMLAFLKLYDAYTNGKFKNEIDIACSREYYHYYLRSGDRKKARNTRYYKECLTMKDKFMFALVSCIPSRIKLALRKK